MKHNKIVLALLSCALISFVHASDSEGMGYFNEADHVEAQSAAAVTPHEQKMADRIAKEHDTQKQTIGQEKHSHRKEARISSARAQKSKYKKAKKALEKKQRYAKKD